MLAMLDCASVQKEGLLRKLIRKLRRESGITVRQIRVYGAPVLHIIVKTEKDIKPRVLEKRLHEAGRAIRRAGDLRVSFTKDFQYSQYFIKSGFIEADLTGLYEALAHKAAALLPCETKKVFFSASRMNNTAQNTLTALCVRFRYVLADVKSGGDDFFREIQRLLGISIVLNPTPAQLLEADAAFFLNAGRSEASIKLQDSCIVYAVNRDVLSFVSYKKLVTALDIEVREETEGQMCDGFPKEALIANALENISITQDDLVICAANVSANL